MPLLTVYIDSNIYNVSYTSQFENSDLKNGHYRKTKNVQNHSIFWTESHPEYQRPKVSQDLE